jgi:hypothetical protein
MRSWMLSRASRFAYTSTSTSAMQAMAAVRNLSGSSVTYYDSQSGMEVPVNNEDEISVFFDHRNGGGSPDTNTNTTMTLEQIQEAGFQGVLWPPPTLATETTPSTSVAANNGFTLFIDSESDLEKIQLDLDHVNLVFEYMDDDDSNSNSNSTSTSPSLQKRLAAHVDHGTNTKTTIGLFDACYYQRDPILVASGVATLIDKTGGGDFIWVQPSNNYKNEDNEGGEGEGEGEEDDSIIDLCQQLSYLDVAGPTIKSRLIVTAQSEYQVEECLNIGVNKFVFQHHDQHRITSPNGVKWFGDMVEEQGKQIKLALSRP